MDEQNLKPGDAPVPPSLTLPSNGGDTGGKTTSPPALHPSLPTKDLAPNSWSAILEYSKGVVTLAVALLGVSVTFSDKLVLDRSDGRFWLLVVTWLFLVLTIIFGVVASIYSIQYLEDGTSRKPAVFGVNASFVSLLIASVTFLGLGIVKAVDRPPPDVGRSISVARACVAEMTATPIANWLVLSATAAQNMKVVNVDLVAPNSQRYGVTVSSDGYLTSLKKLPAP